MIRNLSHKLHPAVLQHAGLAAALKGHCAEVGRQHAIEITFSAADGVDGVPQDVALCLYGIAQRRFEKQVGGRFTVQEGFDIGCDTVTPVSDQYESPFPFTGKIKRVMVDISDKAFEELAEEAKKRASESRDGDAMGRSVTEADGRF